MPVLEKEIENNNVSFFRRVMGGIVTKIQGMGNRSFPDRVYWIPGGYPLIVEYKKPGEEPSKLQLQKIGLLLELGYDVYIVDNKVAGKELLTIKWQEGLARLRAQRAAAVDAISKSS